MPQTSETPQTAMSQTKVFTVPDLGEGLTDATLTAWYVNEGDLVTLNQPLCSLSTAKAEVDIPSPFAGRVGRRHGATGEVIDVGSPLIDLEVPGDGVDHPAARTAAASTSPVTTAEDDEGAGKAVLVGYGTSTPQRRQRNGSRPGGARPASLPEPPPPVPAPTRSLAALAKPPVRALAKRLGVDINALAPGSGANGIVTREDVERAASPATQLQPATRPQPTGVSANAESAQVVPVRGVRALIAERMTLSRQTIPEAWCGRWVDATDLVSGVERWRTSAEPDLAAALTPFAVILRFVVAALRRHPLLNATFDAEASQIRTFDAIHLGVAVADERGLVVPVVRHAEALSTAELALEIRRLIAAVRSGKATPAELSGSTFTVSNFGALGLDDGNPIINVPESAILGVGAIRPRPAVVDGALAVRSTAKLTCVIDHRVCDGAEAGAFLRDLALSVEDPARAILDL